ncbi:hypothetical protein EC988_008764 [Linderina pennispora]|nr:hypothetical protein EC988_008764 [Linderina pennispora]
MPANLVRLDYFMWPEHTDELSFIVSRNITDKRLFDRFAKLVLGAYLSRDFHIKQALASGTYKTIQEAIAHQNSCTRTTPVATWSTEFRDMAAKLVSSSVDLPRHRYQVSTLEMLGILLSDGSLVPRARHAVRICTPDAFLRMLVLLNCGQYGFATASSYMEWYAEYLTALTI